MAFAILVLVVIENRAPEGVLSVFVFHNLGQTFKIFKTLKVFY